MLYIFHVDTGATLTFDIKLALQSVSELKEAIERRCGVMSVHQVLLMSGGESLEPNARVCSYSAGTDTNPIYLFSKAAIESHIPPVPHTDYSSDIDLVDQINASLAMPATYGTLVARAQLAQQCYVLAREQTRTCERLVHDQHLQQQGWAAVVANLEDITHMFQSRAEVLQQSFALYLNEREQHMQLLNNFNGDLGTLSKIPILPALRAQAEGLLSPDDSSSDDQQKLAECTSNEVLSLLKWISAKDNQSSLEQVAEQCSRGLEQFDERMSDSMKSEINAAIDAANKPDMKEIKRLGERLFALEQLMSQTKRLVQEQGELAQGFSQNQTRASNLGDPSVLPDLCASHRRQLIVMMENHSQLRDIRRRCAKAKEELSVNIYHRLKWIMYVENKMMEVDGKLVMYNESLKRLRRHLEVIQQIHLAPHMYISAVAEVVRRRTFSQAFLVWASNLACELLTVHSEEISRRREFQNKFDGHFLNTLFPGLEDTPPPFATQAPNVFDTGLPKLTINDMESLKEQLPDLAVSITTPDLDTITQFFLSKSLTDGGGSSSNNSENINKEKDNISMPVDMTNVKDEINERLPIIGDRVGFESETDNEEFEKIGQIADTESKQNSYEDKKQKLQKKLEENLVNTRAEVERLRNILRNVKASTSEAMKFFRDELSLLREKIIQNRLEHVEINDRIGRVIILNSQKFENSSLERERELTIEHDNKISDAKKLLENRDEEIRNMYAAVREVENELKEREYLVNTMRKKLDDEREEMRNLQTRMRQQLDENAENARVEKDRAIGETRDERRAEFDEITSCLEICRENIRKLEDNLSKAGVEQQRAVKEATEKLHIEYRSELETVRARYKMVTSRMERSPSDSSLEKIERPDMIERSNHETIIAKIRDDMKIEKEEAIRDAIEKENTDFELKLDDRLRIASRQMIEESEAHRLRETALVEECQQYQQMIRRLTDDDTEIRQALNEKVDNLEEEKNCLQSKMLASRMIIKLRENQISELESERAILRRELNEERTKICQNVVPSLEDTLQTLMFVGKDDLQVSESKKVRLESMISPSTAVANVAAAGEGENLSKRLELLEIDNKRLSAELRSTRDSKEAIEAKFEALESDKVRLEIELVKERSKRAGTLSLIETSNFMAAGVSSLNSTTIDTREKDMTASVAIVSDTSSLDNTSSYEGNGRFSEILAQYRDLMMKNPGTYPAVHELGVTFNSCDAGDTVLVVWDSAHRHYSVIHDSRTLYILNSECVDTLELWINSDGTPKAKHILGEVIEKQYCHAKKPENRYNVPKGTKFYRVRIKPLAYVS